MEFRDGLFNLEKIQQLRFLVIYYHFRSIWSQERDTTLIHPLNFLKFSVDEKS